MQQSKSVSQGTLINPVNGRHGVKIHFTFTPVELLWLWRSKISCYISPLLQCYRTPEGMVAFFLHLSWTVSLPDVVRWHANTNNRLYCPSHLPPKKAAQGEALIRLVSHMLNALSTESSFYSL